MQTYEIVFPDGTIVETIGPALQEDGAIGLCRVNAPMEIPPGVEIKDSLILRSDGLYIHAIGLILGDMQIMKKAMRRRVKDAKKCR